MLEERREVKGSRGGSSPLVKLGKGVRENLERWKGREMERVEE